MKTAEEILKKDGLRKCLDDGQSYWISIPPNEIMALIDSRIAAIRGIEVR